MDNKIPSRQNIYTRRGDLGETDLIQGPRVAKDRLRIEVGGQLDELSAVLGVARAEGIDAGHREIVLRIQNELLAFGAEVACPSPTRLGLRTIGPDHIRRIEQDIDEIEILLPPFAQFIIPGNDKGSAYFHLARTVCRRAERHLVALLRSEPDISSRLLEYLNRLSDLLFVLARREESLRKPEEK